MLGEKVAEVNDDIPAKRQQPSVCGRRYMRVRTRRSTAPDAANWEKDLTVDLIRPDLTSDLIRTWPNGNIERMYDDLTEIAERQSHVSGVHGLSVIATEKGDELVASRS